MQGIVAVEDFRIVAFRHADLEGPHLLFHRKKIGKRPLHRIVQGLVPGEAGDLGEVSDPGPAGKVDLTRARGLPPGDDRQQGRFPDPVVPDQGDPLLWVHLGGELGEQLIPAE